MDRILIVGCETEVGGHLAHEFGNSYKVLGIALGCTQYSRVCDSILDTPKTPAEAVSLISNNSIQQIIFCGDASRSAWNCEDQIVADTEQLEIWIATCNQTGLPLVLISSDTVFTGPWMFHDEANDTFCESPRATSIREQENRVLCQLTESLVVRTHAFGWDEHGSPLTVISNGDIPSSAKDTTRYATPIYAGLFAQHLDRVLRNRLRGILHLGGTERLNPSQFILRLGERLGSPDPARVIETRNAIEREPSSNETCLKSSRVRKLMGRGLPSFAESLDAIETDIENGLSAKLCGHLSHLVRVA